MRTFVKRMLQIVAFYIIFYICLAAFWLACLAIFLQTIDDDMPRYYGKSAIIGSNPGVGYQPWIKDNPESTLIEFDRDDPKSYEKYTHVIDAFMEKYTNASGTRVCGLGESNSDIVKDGKVVKKGVEACQFDVSTFMNGCDKANDYGFKDGTPCVILTLNRLIGWTPDSYNASDCPTELNERCVNDGSIVFKCDGATPMDKEYTGNVTYLPPHGIDAKFYPYAVMDNYHQPFAMVRFDKLPLNRVVPVECRDYAKNIEQNVSTRLGMVTFELLIVQKNATKA